MKLLSASTGLLLLLASGPVAAQNGAMWLDRSGRMMSLQFGGGSGEPPAALDRSPEQMAELFHSLCVATEGDPARIGAAAETAGAGLASQPHTIPGARNAPPIELGVWRGEGLVIARTDGFFAAPSAQCNAIFYVQSLPEAAAVAAALTAALGSSPANADRAVRRNGRPNPDYAPEWSLGGGKIVVAYVVAGNRYMPGDRVHIAIRAR